MLIEQFRNRNPVFYIVVALYCIGVFLPLFFRSSLIVYYQHSFVFSAAPRGSFPESNFFWIIFGIVFTYINSLYINKIVVRFKILEKSGFLPSFIFISLAAYYPELILSPAAVVSILILTWSLDQLYSIFDLEIAIQKLFFVGVAAGLNTLIFSPSIVFFLLVLVALPALKRPTWWEMAIIPAGFFAVIYLIGFTYYMQDSLVQFQQIITSTFPLAGFEIPKSFNPVLYPLVYIFILLVIGFIKYQTGGTLRMIRQLRYIRVINFYLLFTFIIIIFTHTSIFQSGMLVILPVSIFLSIFFAENKGRFYSVLFYLMLVVMVISEVLQY